MKTYQENWIEDLQEFSIPWNTTNMDNNLLGICCSIIGDDTGGTDELSQTLARILQRMLIEKISRNQEL